MKPINIFFILPCFVLLTAFMDQAVPFQIFVKQPHMTDVMAYEKSRNRKPDILKHQETLAEKAFPGQDTLNLSNGLIIKQPSEGRLPLHVVYFYSLPDSILRYTACYWELARFDSEKEKEKIHAGESGRLNEYDAMYTTLKMKLANQLGQPLSHDSGPQKGMSSRTGEFFNRSTVWERADLHAELTLDFKAAEHRIVYTSYWK
jgi:hypothetical protein